MTVMAAPLTIAFMFLSAASVLTVPRRCNGFALLDRTADTTVTVAGGDGHASNAIHRVPDPSGAVSARLVRMARFFPAFHALAARVVSPPDPSLLHSAERRREPCP